MRNARREELLRLLQKSPAGPQVVVMPTPDKVMEPTKARPTRPSPAVTAEPPPPVNNEPEFDAEGYVRMGTALEGLLDYVKANASMWGNKSNPRLMVRAEEILVRIRTGLGIAADGSQDEPEQDG